MPADKIRVYGTTWCPDCARAKQFLNKRCIPFEWIDIEKNDKARAHVVEVNKGYQSVPTIIFPDGSLMVEPSNAELEKKLSIQ
jgi:glutaredoxin-like protein